MRAVAGLLVGLIVCLLCVSLWLPARAQTEHVQPFGQGLIALESSNADGIQQVTLIDPKDRVISVYHIESATGVISLRSVRSIRWDFQLEEFNGKTPKPKEIRSLIQPR